MDHGVDPHGEGVPQGRPLTGLRGVGKTVLLQHYTRLARVANWLVAEREFSEPDVEPTMFPKRVLADLMGLGRELSFSKRLKNVGGDLLERTTDLLSGLTIACQGVEVPYDKRRAASARFNAAALAQRDAVPLLLVLCGLPKRMFTVELIGHPRSAMGQKGGSGTSSAQRLVTTRRSGRPRT